MMYFGGGDAELFSYQHHSLYCLISDLIPKNTKSQNFENQFENMNFWANRKLSASANSQSETFLEKIESFFEKIESFFEILKSFFEKIEFF